MATQFAVDLVFNAPRTDAFSKLQRQAEALERAFQGVSADKPFEKLGRDAQKAEKDVNGLTRATVGLKAAASGVSAAWAAAGAAIAGLGVGLLAREMIQAAGSAQQLSAAFTSLTGSAEAAEKLRDSLFRLSKTTPFENDSLLQAARGFLAVGVEVDRVEGTINRVGALAANAGQPLDRIALIYSQIYAKGRLQGEENLQLLEAGIDIQQELAQVTGLSGAALQDAMSKGKIGIDAVNKALVLATGNMEGLDLAAKSVAIQWQNLGDNAGQVFLGLSKALSPALAAIPGVLNQAFDKVFPDLGTLDKVFAPLLAEAERFNKLLTDNQKLVDAIATAFESLLNFAIKPAVDGLESINNTLEKNPQALVNAILDMEVALRKSLLTALAVVSALEAVRRFLPGLSFDPKAGVAAAQDSLKRLNEANNQQRATLREFATPEAKDRAGDLSTKGGAEDAARADSIKRLTELEKDAAKEVRDLNLDYIKEMGEARKDILKDIKAMEKDLADKQRDTARSLVDAQADLKLQTDIRGLQGTPDQKAYMKARLEEEAAFSQRERDRKRSFDDKQRDLATKLEDFKVKTAETIGKINKKYLDNYGKIQEKYAENAAKILMTAAENMGKIWEAAATNVANNMQAGSSSTSGGGGSGVDQAKKLLRDAEGFRSKPYWDVNAYRAGYGSDTITDKSGKYRRVKVGDTVTKEDAERDLERRVNDLFKQLGVSFGDAFKKLPAAAQAAIASVYYNYGKIPSGVAAALKKGDLKGLGNAVGALGGDDGGINRARRTKEANMIRNAQTTATSGNTSSTKSALVDKFGVAWQSQLDNASGKGWRECFTTVSAMIASAATGKYVSDDAYAQIRSVFGDTTNMSAQVKALNSMGVDAKGTTTASKQDLIDAVSKGMAVGIGVTSSLNGHWLYVTGASSKSITAFDPNSKTPKQIEVPWSKFLPGGPNSGYMVTASRAPGTVAGGTGSSAARVEPQLTPLPKPLPPQPGPNLTVELAPYRAQLAEFRKAEEDLLKTLSAADWEKLVNGWKDAITGITAGFDKQIEQNDILLTQEEKRLEYMEQGINPALAQQFAELDSQFAAAEKLLQLEIDRYSVALQQSTLDEQKKKDYQDLLNLAIQQKDALGGQKATLRNQAVQADEKKKAPRTKLIEEIGARQEKLDELLNPATQLISAADSIGDAFAQAFQDIASGSKTAKEAMADMFSAIGASFIQMAAKIAAEQLTLGLMKMFMGALGGGLGGGGGAVAGLFGNAGILNSGIGAGFGGSFAGGGYTGDGARSGGVDGMGGFPAILHPQETVIDHTRPSSAVLDTFQGNSSSSDEPIRLETTTINSVEYATVGQVRAASAAAAKQGEARALNRLYSSTSTRKRLGM